MANPVDAIGDAVRAGAGLARGSKYGTAGRKWRGKDGKPKSKPSKPKTSASAQTDLNMAEFDKQVAALKAAGYSQVGGRWVKTSAGKSGSTAVTSKGRNGGGTNMVGPSGRSTSDVKPKPLQGPRRKPKLDITKARAYSKRKPTAKPTAKPTSGKNAKQVAKIQARSGGTLREARDKAKAIRKAR